MGKISRRRWKLERIKKDAMPREEVLNLLCLAYREELQTLDSLTLREEVIERLGEDPGEIRDE
jgi:hypothetical protein